ncbi:MAG: GIY-YIG nuclease family protein [Brumimicrobium sp.]
MSHYLYILYSTKINKYYIGYSTNPDRRLGEHNNPQNKNWTKRGQPWDLKVSILYDNESLAKKAEYKLKSLKSRRVIEQVIETGEF